MARCSTGAARRADQRAPEGIGCQGEENEGGGAEIDRGGGMRITVLPSTIVIKVFENCEHLFASEAQI